MKNNLFSYATSELSQDAFICWLLSFLLKDSRVEPALKACAGALVGEFIPQLKGEEIYADSIKRQFKSIDILLTINGKYKVIIEDKTFSSEHDSQLKRYKDHIQKEYPDFNVICIYFKTGFQSDLREIEKSDYQYFGREKFLSILAQYAGQIDNQIFLDYYHHLDDFEKKVQEFRSSEIADWKWEQINGFFDHIKKTDLIIKHGLEANYGYISNQKGGFHGMWIYGGEEYYATLLNLKFEQYLQIEENFKICFKISINKEDYKKRDCSLLDFRNQLLYNTEGEYRLKKYGFSKPEKLGSGRTMTLGIFIEQPQNLEEAATVLEKALEGFKASIRESPSWSTEPTP